jgi:transposase
MEGLKDRTKSDRPPEISQEVVYKIKSQLLSSKQGWTTKQVNDIIVRESCVQYHQIYIYTLLQNWGFKQKVPRKVPVNTASKEKEGFKKEQERYCWILSNRKKGSK